MKVAIPGRAMKMQEHFGSGTTHLGPLLKHGKIPFNNILIKPHIDYININNATQNVRHKEDQIPHLNNKEWKRTTKLYKKELKAKGNIRPSTAVRQHVKKISEEFTITHTKYENSVNTSVHSKTTEGKEKSLNKPALANSPVPSISQKIPQSKFPKNVLSKITCSKCESISKASRKGVTSPVASPVINGSAKSTTAKNPASKSTNPKNPSFFGPSVSSSGRTVPDISSPQKKSLVASISPPEASPRLRMRHSSARCRGGSSGFDFCLAPTNPGLPRSPGRKHSSSLAGISPRSQQASSEQIRRVKLYTERAILEGRVFSIFGYFPAVKDALRRRGWVEKIQHTVPYVNPHPSNCMCPHVGYQLSFMSPLSGISTTPSSQSHASSHPKTTSLERREAADEESLEGEQNSEENGAFLDSASSEQLSTESTPSATSSDNKELSQSSTSSLTTPSSNSSSSEANKEQKITASSISSSLDTVVSSSKLESVNCETNSNDASAKFTNDNSNMSPENVKSSNFRKEESENNTELTRNSDNFNTAILDPSEIRKGIAESITEKNAPIFKYSTANITKRKSENNNTDTMDKDSPPLETDVEPRNPTEIEAQEENPEDGKEKEEVEEEEGEDGGEKGQEEIEDGPEPYNPYVEYELTDGDLPLVARLLRNVEPNFLWTWTRDSISFKHLSREQLVNRFPNTPFTTKYGLCSTLQQLHWFSEAASADTFVPRGYCIGHEDERTAFIHDYRTTACLNVLKWVTERYETLGPQSVSDLHGEVPMKRVRQALTHVEQYIQSCCHDDLDSPPPITLRDHEWDSLLSAHYKIVHMDKKIKVSSSSQLQQLVSECESAVQRVMPFWPQLSMDGLRNLWIVKPGAQSRGRGIFMMNHLEEILALVQSPLIYETKYVVQKYMERPLLIHNTKFDIRQWFLVTDWNPLHVWVYKECYLRFCSQQYDLTNNNEAIHLSNNAIQCKYLNGERSGELPEENMWDCSQFKEYLRGLKKEYMWEEVIYPGMRDALVAAMLAAQVEMDTFKHGFELFGADFMLTEDLRPWLIEINSSPCMAPTTSVTRRMCAQCLQDVVKVVIDYKHVKTADTGLFQLAYRDNERSIPNPPYLGVNLQVVGRQIKKGPVKIERKKPKKTKPAPRVVKPLPLITLSLEDGANYGPKEGVSNSKDAAGDPLSRHCSILDCRRYSSSSTTSVPVSATENSSEADKEPEKGKVSVTNTPDDTCKGTSTFSQEVPGQSSSETLPVSKKDDCKRTKESQSEMRGEKSKNHVSSLAKLDKDKHHTNVTLRDYKGS